MDADVLTPTVGIDSRGKRDAEGHRRWKGLGASMALHLLFLLLVFGSLKGAAITGGGGTPQGEIAAINISLAGLKSPRQDASAKSAQALSAMFFKIRAQQQETELQTQDEQKPRPANDLLRLFDVTEPTQTGGKSDTDQGGTGDTVQTAKKSASTKRSATRPSAREGPGAAASAGNLWGQIEPCWDRLSTPSTMPVTLEIELDGRGMIAKPPIILRPMGAPDERRLISEARALAATAACVPYQSPASPNGPRRFRVEFAVR